MSVPSRFRIMHARVENPVGEPDKAFSHYMLQVREPSNNVASFGVSYEEFVLLMLALGAKQPNELIGKELDVIHCSDASAAVDQVVVKQLHAMHGSDYLPPALIDNRVSDAAMQELYYRMAKTIAWTQSAPDLSYVEKRVVFSAVSAVVNHVSLDEPWVRYFLDQIRVYLPDGFRVKRKPHGRFPQFPCRQLELVITSGPWWRVPDRWYVSIIPDGHHPVYIEKA